MAASRFPAIYPVPRYRILALLPIIVFPLMYALFFYAAYRYQEARQRIALRALARTAVERLAEIQADLLARAGEQAAWWQQHGTLADSGLACAAYTEDGVRLSARGSVPDWRPDTMAAWPALTRGRRVFDLVQAGNRFFWYGAQQAVAPDRPALLFTFLPVGQAALLPDSGNETIYLWLRGASRAQEVEGSKSFPLSTLPRNLLQHVLDVEQIAVAQALVHSSPVRAAAVPLKDYEMWDVRGVLLLLQPTGGLWCRVREVFRQADALAGFFGTVLMMILSLLALRRAQAGRAVRPARHPAVIENARGSSFKIRLQTAILLPVILSWMAAGILQANGTYGSAGSQITDLLSARLDAGAMAPLLREAKFALQGARAEFLGWLAVCCVFSLLAYFGFSFVARNLRRPAYLRRVLAGYGFLSPAAAHLVLFSLAPILFALYISFYSWSILTPERPFVGFENYHEVLTNRDFWNSLKNTALYTLHVPVGMAVALGLALMLNRKNFPGLGLLRTIFYLPSITSFVAIAIVWQWIYNPDFGLLNYALSFLDLGPYPWLNAPATALISLMLMAVWIQAGYQMVIFLAGLQNIPKELYDAAKIDGAGSWQRFRRITLPLLQPTTFFILVTSVIGSFQVFTQIYVMTEGGPLKATEVIVYHIYKNAWDYLRMGYASAMSFLLFVIIMALTLVQFRFMSRRQTWEG